MLEKPRDLVWSRERWFLTITITFAVQVIVIIWLSSREELRVAVDARKLQTQYYPADLSQTFAPLLNVMDPSVFSRANPEGFSGEVWLNVKPIEHRSPGWKDKPQFLKFDEEQLLDDLKEFGGGSSPRRQPIQVDVTKNVRKRAALGDTLKPAPVSAIQIGGQLANSDLVRQPQAPVIEFDGVLTSTKLELQVDQRGRVFSVFLASKSGSPAADKLAMQIARSLQFVAAEGFSPTTDNRDFKTLRRATMTVHWWTVPVPVVPPVETPTNNTPPNVEPVQ